jgi:hypothetical protein
MRAVGLGRFRTRLRSSVLPTTAQIRVLHMCDAPAPAEGARAEVWGGEGGGPGESLKIGHERL